MMEPVFIAAVIMVGALVTTSYFVTNGVGTMGAPLRQLALFLMNKAPVGLVDLFKDNPGSGSRTWMKYGIVWFLLALVSGFLGIWHNYDPSALDSLASIGWSYDDGSALADFTASTFNLAFTYLVVGGCLVAVRKRGRSTVPPFHVLYFKFSVTQISDLIGKLDFFIHSIRGEMLISDVRKRLLTAQITRLEQL